ncbi:hypothetical protein D3C76_1591250 [compost metagenome]
MGDKNFLVEVIKILEISEEGIRRQTKLIEEYLKKIEDDAQKQKAEFLSQGYTEDQLETVRKNRDGEIIKVVQLKENVKPKSL